MKKIRMVVALFMVLVFWIEEPCCTKAEIQQTSQAFSSFPLLFCDTRSLLKEQDGQQKYKIKYYLNGGIQGAFAANSYTQEKLPLDLTIPSRPGYNFAGWYLEDNYRTKISRIEEADSGDLYLYAKWTRCIDSFYNVQMYSYQTSVVKGAADKKLKDCTYGFVNNIEIPGMPATREQDYMDNLISSYGQCPQGICLTEDYYLITAYCTEDKKSPGSLYVFDRFTGEYLVTLGMKNSSHLGGLTCDGTNIWICHSDSKALERISYEYIRKVAANKPKAFVDSTGVFEEYRVSNMPSCITAYDGKLWVATHNAYFKSIMISYEYRDDTLKVEDYYRIPEKVQGIAFDDTGNVYLSTSYGREKSSYLKVYDNVDSLSHSPGRPMIKVEMPPCSEEITLADGKVYVLFESASDKYFEGTDGKGKSISPIDKILTIETTSLLYASASGR